MTKKKVKPEEEFNPRHAPMYAMHNRSQIKAAEQCGCYSCLQVCSSKDIVGWTDDSKTGLCPHCGIDCLLPSITKIEELKQIKKMWLPET